MLYYTEKILGLKRKEKLDAILIFKTNNANSRLFGGTRAWLLRVVTTNDIPPHIPRSKLYSMVIFPAAFIFTAYQQFCFKSHAHVV